MNLLEAMMAAAMVAGVALVTSSYIVNSNEDSKKLESSSTCSVRLQSMVGAIKARDNNGLINSWLPGPGRLDPTAELDYPITYNMLHMNVDETTEIAYPAAEMQISANTGDNFRNWDWNNIGIAAQRANNWQLVRSASTLLTPIYHNTNGAEFVLVNNGNPTDPDGNGAAGDDFLSQIAMQYIGGMDNPRVEAQIEVEDTGGTIDYAAANAPSRFNPLIMNNNPDAPTTHDRSYRVSLRLSYLPLNADQRKVCETTINVKPGRLPNPPDPLTIEWEPLSLADQRMDRYLCGTPGTRPGFRYRVSGIGNGSQVLCRMDHAENENGSTAFTSTGWFICGLGANFGGGVITAESVMLNGFSLEVTNTQEGFYRFHVMEIDVARNATITSGVSASRAYDVGVDLNRPGPASVNQPTSGALRVAAPSDWLGSNAALFPGIDGVLGDAFQCSGGTAPWTASPGTEPIEVTPKDTGVASGVSGSGVTATCGNTNLQNVSQSGEYEAVGISCDLCGNGPESPRETWTADIPDDLNVPNPGGGVKQLTSTGASINFSVASGVVNGNHEVGPSSGSRLPTAVACPQFNGSTITGDPEVIDVTSGAGNCDTPSWEAPSGCHQNTTGAGGFCYHIADGCGRYLKSAYAEYEVRGNDDGVTNSCSSVSCASGYVCDHLAPGTGFCKKAESVVWTKGPNNCYADSTGDLCENDTQDSECIGDSYRCVAPTPPPCDADFISIDTSNHPGDYEGAPCTRKRKCRKTETEEVCVPDGYGGETCTEETTNTYDNKSSSGTTVVEDYGTCSAPDASPAGDGVDPFCPPFPGCGDAVPPPPSPPAACTATPTCPGTKIEVASMAECNSEYGDCEEVIACAGTPEENSIICGGGDGTACLAGETTIPGTGAGALAACNNDGYMEDCTLRNNTVCAKELACLVVGPCSPCGTGLDAAAYAACTAANSCGCEPAVPPCPDPLETCDPASPDGFDSCFENEPDQFCGRRSCPGGTQERTAGFETNCSIVGGRECCEPDAGVCNDGPYGWNLPPWSPVSWGQCKNPPDPGCDPATERVVDDAPQGPITRDIVCWDGTGSVVDDACCTTPKLMTGPEPCESTKRCEPLGATCAAIPPSGSIPAGLYEANEGETQRAVTDACCSARAPSGNCVEPNLGIYQCQSSGSWLMTGCEFTLSWVRTGAFDIGSPAPMCASDVRNGASCGASGDTCSKVPSGYTLGDCVSNRDGVRVACSEYTCQ